MQVSDRLNIKLPLKYPVKFIGTAVLNYNLFLDKVGHKLISIIFSFNVVRKHVSIQESSDCQIIKSRLLTVDSLDMDDSPCLIFVKYFNLSG